MATENNELYKYNESTLKTMFKKCLGINAEIKTYDNPWQGKWCVYPRLGIIAPRFPSTNITAFVLSQYDTRGGFAKIAARKMARAGYLCSLGLLAAKSMDIKGTETLGNNMFFWWRGRSMRLYNFADDTIVCIFKKGIPRKNIENIIRFRKKYYYDFMIELTDYGNDWYQEPIMYGKTLSMYKNKKGYTTLLKQSVKCMKQIADDTVHFKNPKDYAEEICQQIEKNINSMSKDAFNYDGFKQTVNSLKTRAQKLDKPVPVALAHCDFHPQNILIDKNRKIYIIDWEANNFRSIWYDPASLLLNFRQPEGMRNMLLNYCEKNIIDAVLINDEQKIYNMESLMCILLLENILGKTIIAGEMKHGTTGILDNYTEKLSNINWC
ncbi:MAG TPA: phosphotransferase [Syntrophomonadaceae bacterium]|nr:phosphotransferase [Syntrophomonadaceae bacterium]HPR93012.1 phosphotransferase [Syntrophomonadaceae bacterium]